MAEGGISIPIAKQQSSPLFQEDIRRAPTPSPENKSSPWDLMGLMAPTPFPILCFEPLLSRCRRAYATADCVYTKKGEGEAKQLRRIFGDGFFGKQIPSPPASATTALQCRSVR